jgi:hypothetical protein
MNKVLSIVDKLSICTGIPISDISHLDWDMMHEPTRDNHPKICLQCLYRITLDPELSSPMLDTYSSKQELLFISQSKWVEEKSRLRFQH